MFLGKYYNILYIYRYVINIINGNIISSQYFIELIGKCEQYLIWVNLSSSTALSIFPFLIIQADASPCLKFIPRIIINKIYPHNKFF